MIKKFAIIGPECTGKTTLCKQLANYFETIWVKEYAREYLKNIERPYNQKDILNIAKGQIQREISESKKAHKLIFIDTELIVIKIWSEYKYQNCHPWILKQLKKQNYVLYLLCDIDLPWKEDPLREHPQVRKPLFELYKQELESRNLNFEIVSGTEEKRFNNALRFVTSYL